MVEGWKRRQEAAGVIPRLNRLAHLLDPRETVDFDVGRLFVEPNRRRR